MSPLRCWSSSSSINHIQRVFFRSIETAAASASSTEPRTHFKITLRRSAIGLGEKKKETLVSLGLHRRMQTVYHPHTPEAGGKILKVKELVEVENVPASAVRTQEQQRQERKASRGYAVAGSRMRAFQWERTKWQ
ncbi:hypothetical protein BKA82DRAFT_193175 [Pisolithus tinctorius]|uniref:Large ribosomal subunit protein uL30m n=1 Tax=Pisolithus tinctorius Marx 270 TaxID=870435 RepID=A0A0C3KZL9_PISTI|nr:hypothetical protein BKA82DRAFT_193175 [Pisolithus tinctorius]KIO14917.1 hypothetical protein M404DRAFT_193175 [Pisolithus tinctorius Marx 270]